MVKKHVKIGIMGGTFDPVHLGHLQCAKVVADKLELDKVLFMPANIPNFKQNKHVTAASDRLKMCKLAIEDFNDDRFGVSDFELWRDGVTYTSDTLEMLKKDLFSNADLFFICGSDSAYSVDSWHKATQIFENATIVSVGRKGYKKNVVLENKLKDKFDNKIMFIEADVVDISSSKLRDILNDRNNASTFMSSKVLDYIIKNHLYL